MQHPVQIHDERVAKYLQYMPKKLTELVANEVKAPMPGLLKSLSVQVGQLVRLHFTFHLSLSLLCNVLVQ